MTRHPSGLLQMTAEIERALIRSEPVVALETSIVAHGLPADIGVEVARECEARVRGAGAVPATVAVIDGAVRVGLDDADLERLATGPDIRKVGPRDLATCAVSGASGATTVGGTIAVCTIAGIHFMATGGIGGGHRGWAETRDVSPHLGETALSAEEVETAIEEALAEAREQGIDGPRVSPFVLAALHGAPRGRSLAANRRLVVDNAELAARVAAAYYAGPVSPACPCPRRDAQARAAG